MFSSKDIVFSAAQLRGVYLDSRYCKRALRHTVTLSVSYPLPNVATGTFDDTKLEHFR